MRLPAATPAPVRELLRRCLEKEPQRRLQPHRRGAAALEGLLGADRAGRRWRRRPAPEPGNLPRRFTSFHGREPERLALRDLIAEASLVTIVGPGGVGKTRLALEVAQRRSEADYPDGAWFVDLAPVADPSTVPAVVAAALRLSPRARAARRWQDSGRRPAPTAGCCSCSTTAST